MDNRKDYLQILEDKLFELEERWRDWKLDLSLPSQIYEVQKKINKLITNK
jgi:hypothetical protein